MNRNTKKVGARLRFYSANTFYWFTSTTKITSMSGGNLLGCLLPDSLTVNYNK